MTNQRAYFLNLVRCNPLFSLFFIIITQAISWHKNFVPREFCQNWQSIFIDVYALILHCLHINNLCDMGFRNTGCLENGQIFTSKSRNDFQRANATFYQHHRDWELLHIQSSVLSNPFELWKNKQKAIVGRSTLYDTFCIQTVGFNKVDTIKIRRLEWISRQASWVYYVVHQRRPPFKEGRFALCCGAEKTRHAHKYERRLNVLRGVSVMSQRSFVVCWLRTWSSCGNVSVVSVDT